MLSGGRTTQVATQIGMSARILLSWCAQAGLCVRQGRPSTRSRPDVGAVITPDAYALTPRTGHARRLSRDERALIQCRLNDGARPKPRRLHTDPALRAAVDTLLAVKISPPQIAARLKHLFADDGSMHITAETIYQEFYLQARSRLLHEL